MKFLGALTLLAAGFATAATSVPYDEAHEWRQCTVNMLNEFGRDLAGDKAACHLWTCLHDKAETFNRGGVITRISNALTPFCLAVQTFPDFGFGSHAREVTASENGDWMRCTNNLLDGFDTGSSGNKAACEMLSCLQNQASKYNRGGVLTKASSVLTPICTGIGAFAPNKL